MPGLAKTSMCSYASNLCSRTAKNVRVDVIHVSRTRRGALENRPAHIRSPLRT